MRVFWHSDLAEHARMLSAVSSLENLKLLFSFLQVPHDGLIGTTNFKYGKIYGQSQRMDQWDDCLPVGFSLLSHQNAVRRRLETLC